MQCHSVCYVIIPIVLSNFSAFGFASGVTSKMGGTWNVGIYHRTCNGSGSKKEEICLHPTNLTLLMANHPTNATPYWKVSPLLIAKMNYSEPWFLRHIVYSDLNFNSASFRRELWEGGVIVWHLKLLNKPSEWAFANVVSPWAWHWAYIYYICFRFAYFCLLW